MPHRQRSEQIPVAVVGIGSLTPGAPDAETFWKTMLEGQDLLTEVPPTHWLIDDYFDPDPSAEDRTYCRRGAFLSDVEFDPSAYGIAPNVLPATDTAQLLALVVAERVLADLRRNSGGEIDRERTSVIIGTGALDLLRTMSNRLQRPVWLKALRESGLPETAAQAICDRIAGHYVPWQEATFPGVLGNVVAGRIANRFDLHGTNVTVDAACASSLAAVAGAVHELAEGVADTVITGGVDTLNDILTYMCFSKTPALSPTGDCRPFSDAADGTMLGEAVVMFALRRLADAERDGDRVYAVIRGIGSSSDGRGGAIYAPVPEGQARALRRAYAAAGYGPDTVDLVEGHGTGTKAGDVAEFGALRAVFDSSGRPDRQWCALGSAKSQLGHTKSAAGAVGMLKAIFALQHKVLPPTLKVDRPNPVLDLPNSPLYLNTAARPWIKSPALRRRASVSSFGFGGTNFHLTLEEYAPPAGGPTGPVPAARCAPTELLLVSGASPTALLERARSLADDAGVNEPLHGTAMRSQQRFDSTDRCRLAVVAADPDQLADRLRQVASLVAADPGGPHTMPGASYRSGAAEPGRVAWLFSGQGSQYVNMGAELAMSVPQARATWDRAAGIWSTGIDDRPLHDVVFPIPVFNDEARAAQQALLIETEWAQPALAVQSLALLAVLRTVGMTPDCVGGHSFGELVALHAAGGMDEASLIRMARRRGELMRDAAAAAEPGAMLALDMSRAEAVNLLGGAGPGPIGDGVWLANDNGPRQVVLAGRAPAVADLERRLAAAGITPRRLPTAGAFHTPLMAAAREPFLDFLRGLEVKPPQIDVYGNADAGRYPADADRVRERLAEHLVSPVRFAEQIEAMYEAGVRTFVEIGAGAAIAGLVRQALGERPHVALSLDRRGRHGLTALQEGLGTLATTGVEMDLAPLWSPFQSPRTRPSPPARMAVRINGANYGSPYPPPGGSDALPPPNPEPAPGVSSGPVTPARAVRPAPPAAAATAPAPPAAPARQPAPWHGDEAVAHLSSPAGPVTGPATSTGDAWLSAFQEAQRQTAEAHAEFQRTMTESHLAFLATVEASLAGLAGTSLPVAPASPAARDAAVSRFPGDAAVETSAWQPRATRSAPMPALGRDGDADDSAYANGNGNGAAADAVMPSVAAMPTAGPRAAGADRPERAVDVAAVLVEVIAEKTGFPAEVVDPHLELEADLGIDSIKRVEIFSALRNRLPDLTTLDLEVAELAKLRTVDQIADAFRGAPPAAGAGKPAAIPTPAATPAAVAATATSDVAAVLVEVIAEKTGFPAEVVDPHLELEADLGIDSIKRVEIFSALRNRLPDLTTLDLDVAELAKLRTVDQIADAFRGALPAPGAVPTPARPSLWAEATAPALPEPTAWHAQPPPDLTRSVSVLVPASLPGLELPGLRAGTVVITADGTGVAERLADRLRGHGIAASAADPAHSPLAPEVRGLIILSGLRPVGSVGEAIAVNREAFRIARATAPRLTAGGGVLVVVQDTGGDFGLSGGQRAGAWLGGLAGLARTLGKEWPAVHAKAVDCERGSRDADSLARVLADELLLGGTQQDVGLGADGTRTVLREAPAEPGAGEPAGPARWPARPDGPVRSDGTGPVPWSRTGAGSLVVATGGGRGVTAQALRALVAAERPTATPTVALLGRTPLEPEPPELRDAAGEKELRGCLVGLARRRGLPVDPAEIAGQAARVLAVREIRATIEALERAGAAARYVAVDVRDAPALDAALARLRDEFGPITGLIHGAGVLADGYLADKTDKQFADVFDTKVEGLRALLDATVEDPLGLVCVFSSAAGRFGNPGQSDYAMANEVIAQVASTVATARPDCVVRSLAWGPWDGGMVSPELGEHFRDSGMALITLEAGARAFVREVASGPGPVRVTLVAGSQPDPFADGPDRGVSGVIQVAQQTHPYLADHAPAGKPVLPLALALEWFLRAARGWRPDARMYVLHDLTVLRRIDLDQFSGNGQELQVRGRRCAPPGFPPADASPDGLRLELVSAAWGAHYRTTVRAETPAGGSWVRATRGWQPPAGSHAGNQVLDRATAYRRRVLFHGPAFQVIQTVESLGAERASATVAGVRAMGWPDERWHTDPAAVDAGLQLALLWAATPSGMAPARTDPSGRPDAGAYLPMSIAQVRIVAEGPVGPAARCVVLAGAADQLTATCDVGLLDADGRPLAELLGVRLVRRPDDRPDDDSQVGRRADEGGLGRGR